MEDRFPDLGEGRRALRHRSEGLVLRRAVLLAVGAISIVRCDDTLSRPNGRNQVRKGQIPSTCPGLLTIQVVWIPRCPRPAPAGGPRLPLTAGTPGVVADPGPTRRRLGSGDWRALPGGNESRTHGVAHGPRGRPADQEAGGVRSSGHHPAGELNRPERPQGHAGRMFPGPAGEARRPQLMRPAHDRVGDRPGTSRWSSAKRIRSRTPEFVLHHALPRGLP
jgi:hypothetical protein